MSDDQLGDPVGGPGSASARPEEAGLSLVRPDDRVLAEAARAGDEAAFRELYRRHAQRVYARLTRLVGPCEEREDLVQQVFWKLHQALPRYRGDAPVEAFLHGIVTRVAYGALRKRGRTPTQRVRDVDLDLMVAATAEPELRSQQRQTPRRLFTLLDSLKPKQRVAFVLHTVEGLSLTEVAHVTGASPRTTGQRVAAARKHIQRLLDRQALIEPGAEP